MSPATILNTDNRMTLKESAFIIYDLLLFIGMAIVHVIEAFMLMIIPVRYRAKSIKGEIALVTGGANGIGKLIAMKLAELGAHVVIWDINKTGLTETKEEIKKAGGICHAYYCDISDKEQIYRTAKAVIIEAGNVSLLVNNAGYVYGKTFMELPDYAIEHTFKVNTLSHYWITKSFLKDMMKNNHGHIVTIASLTGVLGTYNCTDYSATKFATVGYHESLFTELKTHRYDGINMTLVCPYLINTGMFHGITPPRSMPMLEPEYVANEVVTGILTNKMFIVLPKSIRYLLPFKYMVPTKTYWALMHHVVKAPQTMIQFKGRDSKETVNNNAAANYKNTCVY